ncbi:hypothetical protein CALVIDRAFT_564890 [Calocera viscosa TUFC12733]|uniref:Uncharacterized protein n=1 Tax=Calocera viscosa (strain TUFC12733) TaxID=1330018 RepID=A0A167KX19_CALVF|nr:hypothetical protein CALVIDRAFT_564890 [Calocera viscosa TUFC12733]
MFRAAWRHLLPEETFGPARWPLLSFTDVHDGDGPISSPNAGLLVLPIVGDAGPTVNLSTPPPSVPGLKSLPLQAGCPPLASPKAPPFPPGRARPSLLSLSTCAPLRAPPPPPPTHPGRSAARLAQLGELTRIS